MKSRMVDVRFFETYYYANVISNVLEEPAAYLRGLNEWHEDRATHLFLAPFPKWTVLHSLSEHIISCLIFEGLHETSPQTLIDAGHARLWIDRALEYHGIATPGFRSWLDVNRIKLSDVTEGDVSDYHSELGLSGELGALLERLADEVFYVLFGNRVLLQRLNRYVAGVVEGIEATELAAGQRRLLARDGRLARVRIPAWARRAVYFRDRGRCATCHRDISGSLSISGACHLDHVVPLAHGGINDVTNLQLLCEGCNLRKGRNGTQASSMYEAWYDRDL